MMDPYWFEPVMAYCERTGPGFWGEPLNAVSNGAFLIAAAAAALRAGRQDPAATGLTLLIAVVGIGSFLFHTLANRWSLLADVIPIGVFIYAYFFLALVRFFGMSAPTAFGGTLLFAGFGFGLTPALDTIAGRSTDALANGSIAYLPALLALLGIGGALLLRPAEAARQAGFSLLAIAALFLLSLSVRTIDRAICPYCGAGTHPLWHLLNAAVLYALIIVAVRFRERRQGQID